MNWFQILKIGASAKDRSVQRPDQNPARSDVVVNPSRQEIISMLKGSGPTGTYQGIRTIVTPNAVYAAVGWKLTHAEIAAAANIPYDPSQRGYISADYYGVVTAEFPMMTPQVVAWGVDDDGVFTGLKLERKPKMASQQTFYRVYCKPLYGGSASHPTAQGTYWTPRWDSVVRMMRTIYREFISLKGYKERELWETTVFKLTNADFKDPPKEHAWAFSYGVDAGEQILDVARETPEVVFKGFPDDQEFVSIIEEPVEEVVDHSRYNSVVKTPQGLVYLSPDYRNKVVGGYIKEGWRFIQVHTFRNGKEVNDFIQKNEIVEPFDPENGLGYGMADIWDSNPESERPPPTQPRRRRSTRTLFDTKTEGQ